MATNHNPEKGPRTPTPRKLDCEAWQAMLADALDGTLEARDAEAFAAHSKVCAGCGELLEESKRGTEWLRFLRQTPEAPEGLVDRILAGTSGGTEIQPLAATGVVALPRTPWMGASIALLQRHVAESRILMTLAMAFFSIALTLNLTGVHLNQLKLSDLRPATLASSVSHQYFTTSAHLTRYYSNLRFVYLLESQLNEIRGNNEHPGTQPSQSQPQQQQQPKPQAQPSSSGKPGGSARKDGDDTQHPAPRRRSYEPPPAPVLAAYPQPHSELRRALKIWAHDESFPYPGNTHKPSERSLV